VWFLVILWIGAGVAAFMIAERLPHFGAAKAIESLSTLLDGLRQRIAHLQPGRATSELLLLAAVFGFWAVPHGMAPGYWIPATEGKLDATLPFNFKPLEPFRDQTVIMSGLHSRSAEPPPGATGADHWVAAAFLCANKPKKTAGADVYVGTTIDQMIAQKYGQDSLLPSLQLGIEDQSSLATCPWGYSCAYVNSISWSGPSKPLPSIPLRVNVAPWPLPI
jgi:hypothetical protein